MNTYSVYHVKSEFLHKVCFGFGVEGKFPEEYTKVAVLQAANPEDVFRLTNSVDSAWYNNPDLQVLVKPCRSTSVGDVIVDETNNKTYRVEMLGFKEV